MHRIVLHPSISKHNFGAYSFAKIRKKRESPNRPSEKIVEIQANGTDKILTVWDLFFRTSIRILVEWAAEFQDCFWESWFFGSFWSSKKNASLFFIVKYLSSRLCIVKILLLPLCWIFNTFCLYWYQVYKLWLRC